MPASRALWVGALAISAGAGLAARLPRAGPLRLEVGGFQGGYLGGDWSRSERADPDPEATADGRTSFYYRASPPNATLRLPVTTSGPLRLTLRGSASVRTGVSVFSAGRPVGELLVPPRRWVPYALELPAPAEGPLSLALALRPLPLVRGSHAEDPKLLVDYVELESPRGFGLSWPACLLVAAVPLVALAFARFVGFSPRSALAGAIGCAVVAVAVVHAAPFAAVLALTRLLPFALVCGLLVHRLLAPEVFGPADRGRLAAFVALGVLAHGSVVFFPNHSPPDIDIHARRARDLGDLPLDYQAFLRYGSQLPSPSQDRGTATAALGERTLIPYSPLPYFFYYALDLLGLDLYWAMTVFNAALAMGVAPLLWLLGERLWGRPAAWLAAMLYAVDLAVWHHVGRSHAPAAFGGALGTAALAFLALQAARLDTPRRALLAAAVLGLAALGYSSLVVLFGLFGLSLLSLLVLDARALGAAAKRGLVIALVVGGLLAGGLFYFHYVPGLLHGAASVEAEPDLFPGRTFLIFHNESRQSMRLWVLGYWVPLLAGLLAAPFALKRAPASVRPVLVSWFLAWAGIMLLKEPFLFPKLLRWAKEDQFLSPLLGLFLAGGVGSLGDARLRRGLAAIVLIGALWLELRDFSYHANSLLL